MLRLVLLLSLTACELPPAPPSELPTEQASPPRRGRRWLGFYQAFLNLIGEKCNGRDDDGDNLIDEGYPDFDGDGRANCIDQETCDGLDNDGNGLIDELIDADRDGYSGCGVDCDDRHRDVHPGAVEDCDGVDDDCDGVRDDGFDADADGTPDCFDHEECDGLDNDGDGWADEPFDADLDGWTTCGGDCEDYHDRVHPGAVEVCDGRDQDCNGIFDDGFDADADGTPDCFDHEECDGLDNDGDGLIDEAPEGKIWQLGVIDGPIGPALVSAEFPAGNQHHRLFRYEVVGEGSVAADMPGYLGPAAVGTFDPTRRLVDAATSVELWFELPDDLISARLGIARYSGGVDRVFLGDELVGEVIGSHPLDWQVSDTALGPLWAGWQRIRIDHVGPGVGHDVDAIWLSSVGCGQPGY
jgi:hypothetical protein